jgi:uncharacterized protein
VKKYSQLLERKNVNISLKYYGVDVLGYMTYGLFSTLIIGLILKEIGNLTNIQYLIDIGQVAMSSSVVGGAIGTSVAYALKAPPLVLFSSVVVGVLGNEAGGILGAFLAPLISVEVGKIVSKETKVDILVTPITTIFVGGIVATLVGPKINWFISIISTALISTTDTLPILMGALLGVCMGILLTLPISSAAISIMIGVDGVVAGAITAGTSAQMVGFAVSSYKENKVGGLVSLGIGTSMIQMPNIIKNPKIWIPPIIASGVSGALATTIFKMENTSAGAGMGTSGLVGQITTLATMGYSTEVYAKILLVHFIVPIFISITVSSYMRKKGHIKFGDMQLDKI